MKTKTTLKFLIAAMLFSLFAVKIKAQIVYTDIDPDTTIYMPVVPWNIDSSHVYYLDLNGNDTIDMNIIIRNYYQYSGGPNFGKSLYILRETDSFVSGGCAIGGSREDISSGDTINEKLNWDEIKYLFHSLNFMSFTCELPDLDTYFGLMIFAVSDTLYGWVRCSATDTSITIKDYAYNSTSNEYILAGQTVSGYDTLTLKNQINIYESNNSLNVDFSNVLFAQGLIKIYNTFGVLLKTASIIGLNNTLNISEISQGIYIIRIETPSAILNKQIYIQGN